MIEDENRAADDAPPPAANDNGNGDAWVRIDAAVLTIARLIGRQMAREAFERLGGRERQRAARAARGLIARETTR